MAKPDVQIGERVFHPKEMGFIDGVKTNLDYFARIAVGNFLLTTPGQYQIDRDVLRLGAFYGYDAVTAFEDAIRLRVRLGHSIIPQPVEDPFTHRSRYQFVKPEPGTQMLVIQTH